MTKTGYCFACGKLRELEECGMCSPCVEDEAVRRKADRMVESARLRAEFRKKWRNMQKR